MEFSPIETQEEFDKRISERLNRQKESYEQKYADYDDLKKKAEEYNAKMSEYQTKYADYDELKKRAEDGESKIATLNESVAKISKDLTEAKEKARESELNAMRMKVAQKNGIPFEISDRLKGETEEELTKDAKAFASFAGPVHTAPRYSPEAEPADKKKAAYKELLNSMTKGA